MSLKRLYGWVPKQTSTVTGWTDDGRPARWETTSEVEWDQRERSLMQALAYYEAGLCQRCGQHLAETMDPDTDPDRPEATRRWVAEGPDECFACKSLIRAETKLAGDTDGGGDQLVKWSVHTPALIAKTPRKRHQHM